MLRFSSLLGHLPLFGLVSLVDPGHGLAAQAGASPVLFDLLGPLVEVGLHSLNELVQSSPVARVDLKRNENILVPF